MIKTKTKENNIQDLYEILKSRIGESISGNKWSATLVDIVEIQPKSLKTVIRFSTKSESFSFDREVKLFYNYFDSIVNYKNEINRLLKLLDEFTNSISTLRSQITNPPTITTKWKGYITLIVDESPIQSIVYITFAQKVGSEIMSFDKIFTLSIYNFLSLNTYQGQLLDMISILNEPISVDYYKGLINQSSL